MSLWSRLADLPLVVEACEYERLDPGPGFGEAHGNRLLRLAGMDAEGLGEDITLFLGEGPDLPLVVGRSTTAARQLASRARRRVQGSVLAPDADLARQRELVDAFFAAARGGDFDALVALLHPDVVLHPMAVPRGRTRRSRYTARGRWPSGRSRLRDSSRSCDPHS